MKHPRVFLTSLFILAVSIALHQLVTMRPRDAAMINQNQIMRNNNGVYNNGINGNHQGNGNGNHAGHFAINGEKPANRSFHHERQNSNFSNGNQGSFRYPPQPYGVNFIPPPPMNPWGGPPPPVNPGRFVNNNGSEAYVTPYSGPHNTEPGNGFNVTDYPIPITGYVDLRNQPIRGPPVIYNYPNPVPIPHMNRINQEPIQPPQMMPQQPAMPMGPPPPPQPMAQPMAQQNPPLLPDPVFVHPEFGVRPAAAVQIYTNGDGYSEYYSQDPHAGRLMKIGFHSEPINSVDQQQTPGQAVFLQNCEARAVNGQSSHSSFHPTEEETKVSETSQETIVSNSPSTLSPTLSESAETPSTEKPEIDKPSQETPLQHEEENQLAPEAQSDSEDESSLENFTFNGANFPQVRDESGDYDKFLNEIGMKIKEFFKSRPEMWKTAKKVTVDGEKIDKAVESQDDNEGSDMLQIDFFIPSKPLLIRASETIELELIKEKASGKLSSNPVDRFSTTEYITESSVFGEMKNGYLSVKFSELNEKLLQELFAMSQNVTVVMYAEFPPANQNNTDSSSEQETRPASPEDGGSATSSSISPLAENQTESQQQVDSRSSRLSEFTNQNGAPTRGRSTSNLGSTTCAKIHQRWNYDNIDPARIFGSEGNQQGSSTTTTTTSRQLPQIPPEYRQQEEQNGQSSEPRDNQNSSPLRRRHQSENSTIRSNFPREWMRDEGYLRFIVPTEREFMARVPFPPYRIPLIGVARRAPGNSYTPQRILPAHENFAMFRRRMQEIRANEDVGDPNNVRGSGPLILEPRGFWYPTDAEMEELERRHQEQEASTNQQTAESTQSTGGDETNSEQEPVEELSSDFRAQELSTEEIEDEEEKRSETADSCRSASYAFNYNQDSDDDDDKDIGGSSFSGVSSSCSKYSPSTPSSCRDGERNQSQKGQSSSSSSSSSKTKQHRPVKDSALKNQRRREKEALRALRKEEERLQKEQLAEKERIRKEKKEANMKLAEEKKRLKEIEIQKLKAIEEERQEQLRLEEEKLKVEEVRIKAEKRRLVNQFNKEKKKQAKKNKYEAAKKAEEEELENRKRALQKMQHEVNQGILAKLAAAKEKLMAHELSHAREEMSPKMTEQEESRIKQNIEPVLNELCEYESLDMRHIRHRSDRIDWFFDCCPKFHEDSREQLSYPERGRFKMSQGICILQELEAMRQYQRTLDLKYAKAVRQYRYWKDNMYDDLSLFINYVVGISEPKESDPTIEQFEEWAIFNENVAQTSTVETIL